MDKKDKCINSPAIDEGKLEKLINKFLQDYFLAEKPFCSMRLKEFLVKHQKQWLKEGDIRTRSNNSDAQDLAMIRIQNEGKK